MYIWGIVRGGERTFPVGPCRIRYTLDMCEVIDREAPVVGGTKESGWGREKGERAFPVDTPSILAVCP